MHDVKEVAQLRNQSRVLQLLYESIENIKLLIQNEYGRPLHTEPVRTQANLSLTVDSFNLVRCSLDDYEEKL